jgi:hypothetical protein
MWCVALLGAFATPVAASPINGSPTGLAAPTSTITFDEVVLPMDTSVTNQYASLGVTFAPNVYYSPQTGFPNINGNDAGNFTSGGAGPINPVTMTFSQPLTGVAFNMAADETPYTFTSFLGGNPVESFTTSVGASSSSNFYGFQNSVFDSIRISQAGAGGGPYWLIDNIQLGAAAATPEPATLAVFGLMVAGGAGYVRRRAKAAA